MATQFDFNNIANLGSFWDGGTNASGAGGGNFNAYSGVAGTNHNLDLLYQNLIGRNADPGGKDYWAKQIESGATTYQGVADALKASNEYTGQQSYLANNPNATAGDLKSLSSAYVSPFHSLSGSAVAGWQPGDALTQNTASAVTTDPNVTGSNYSDQTNKNVGEVINSLGITGGVDNGGGSMQYQQYDDSGLLAKISGLQSAFDAYKTQSEKDMKNMWNNANWGWGGQTVGGVRTQNELPGWGPKKGGTSGFFGRGGRSGKGLTTSSLNI
jgi:hypothetical protein